MINVTEFTITKYPQGKHPHHDGQVVWSRVVTTEEYFFRQKAFYRLASIIQASDPERAVLSNGNTLEVRKERKDASFNDKGTLVYSEDLTDMSEELKEMRIVAMSHLAKYLSSVDKEHNYYAKCEKVFVGKNGYMSASRNTKLYTKEDKEKVIKRKIAGRKAAISRNINKAKAIREEYQTSLFPDAYLTDRKFMQLLKYLPKQKQRLHEAKRMKGDDIEDIVGGYAETSSASIGRLLKHVVVQEPERERLAA